MALTEQEEFELLSLEREKSISNQKPTDPFLPGQEKVEKKIEERQKTSAVKTLKEEVTTPYKGNVLQKLVKAGITGMKTIAVPFERGEAALANPMLELQKAPHTRRSLLDVSLEGLKGERIGQLGDVPRQSGEPEWFASTVGISALVGVTDLVSKKLITRSLKAGETFVKSKFPRFLGKDFVLKQAKVATRAIDDMHAALSKQYDEIFKKIGNKKVNAEAVGDALVELPENIIKRISKSNLVRKNADGSLVDDLENLKQIRGIIRKAVPEKVWNGRALGDPNTSNLQQVYAKLSTVMAEGNDDLIRLNKSYGQFLKTRGEIGDVLWDKNGNVVANRLRTLYSKGGDAGKQEVFKKFSQQYPEGMDVINNVKKFNSRQAAKTLLKKVGATVAIGGIGGAAGGKIIHNLGN